MRKVKKGAMKMATRIYVGGLPYSATEQDLEKLFAAHGTVASATVITDKYTGQAKGFGFVEMSTDQEAQSAINGLNGTSMGGRTLTVNEAKAREERPRTGGGGYGGGGGGSRGGSGGGGGRDRGGYSGGNNSRW
jgi:RNA recognition motif-containing protein